MKLIRRILGKPYGGRSPVLFSVDSTTLAAAERVERGGHCACLASRTKKGSPSVPNLHAEPQNDVPGWRLLLQIIDRESAASATQFEPSAEIPADQWATVITLPSSIASLPQVSSLLLYGSHLRRLPPEIGRLTTLASLDLYTSYSLHWLPYEITRCSGLRETRISTRALYGNAKTRLPFPRLSGPVETLMPQTCSVCDRPFDKHAIQVLWTTQRIATDIVPLLIHSCSAECTSRVPDAPAGYYRRPHRGGGGVGMPDADYD